MRRLGCVLLGAVALLVHAPGAAGQSADMSCALALVKADPAVLNVAFPDESASYWLVPYAGVPGTRLRIEGQYPHARYISFNVYDPVARPIDSLRDTQIAPDAGSANPFDAGADRTGAARDYTVWVEFGAPPEQREPNTLYTGGGQGGLPNPAGYLIYRLYVPDRGRGELGGVSLPRVTLEVGDGGGQAVSPLACGRTSLPSLDLNDRLRESSPPAEADVLPYPGTDPPTWRRFVNLPVAYADGLLENPSLQPLRDAAAGLPLESLGGSGGFFANRDNDYVYAPTSRGYGQVLVLQGRAPTFADTVAGPPAMPDGHHVRYFSLCQNEAFSTRFLSCLRDDQLVLDADGNYTIVVSTVAERPAHARVECGVNWMPWGPVPEGVLIYRHMLPDPSFDHAIQRIARHGQERETLGPYYPSGRYLQDAAAFDAEWGC